MGLKYVCILSSVRDGRNAERMVSFVKKHFDETLKPKGHTLEIVGFTKPDLQYHPEVYNLPVLKQPLHFYSDPTKAPEVLHTLNKIMKEADAYIILTAEYNRSVPPALTNLMNHLPPPSFEFKPSGLLSYSMGPHGGALACAAARPFLSEMGCIPIKHFTTIASVQNEINEDGTTENSHVISSVTQLFIQLDWWARATKTLRDAEGVPQ